MFNTSELMSLRGGISDTTYAFISYSGSQFTLDNDDDMEAVHILAERATRALGLDAYWIKCSCMPLPENWSTVDYEWMNEDVYSISDIVRGADAVVIAVGSPPESRSNKSTVDLLRAWGRGSWHLQDFFLSPRGQPITVYNRDVHGENPLSLTKRRFASMVYSDTIASRRLVDYYEGSLTLSRIEILLYTMALLNDSHMVSFYAGDYSYILAGFLPRRPKVNHTDSAFQAFARLFFANDVDMFLGRLVCLAPKYEGEIWRTLQDVWDINLMDIYPTCHVSGIGNDTLIVDGVFGAAITAKWDDSDRTIKSSNSLASLGTHILRRGKKNRKKVINPEFVCLKGALSLEQLEHKLFGLSKGVLKPSNNSSSLMREFPHYFQNFDPNIIRTPTSELYNLIDASTMAVIPFHAKHAPMAVISCGLEGGMQRALLCSFNLETETLYRESVIRIEVNVGERMSRIDRVQLALYSQSISADSIS
jgi:hypothetical protein